MNPITLIGEPPRLKSGILWSPGIVQFIYYKSNICTHVTINNKNGSITNINSTNKLLHLNKQISKTKFVFKP